MNFTLLVIVFIFSIPYFLYYFRLYLLFCKFGSLTNETNEAVSIIGNKNFIIWEKA